MVILATLCSLHDTNKSRCSKSSSNKSCCSKSSSRYSEQPGPRYWITVIITARFLKTSPRQLYESGPAVLQRIQELLSALTPRHVPATPGPTEQMCNFLQGQLTEEVKRRWTVSVNATRDVWDDAISATSLAQGRRCCCELSGRVCVWGSIVGLLDADGRISTCGQTTRRSRGSRRIPIAVAAPPHRLRRPRRVDGRSGPRDAAGALLAPRSGPGRSRA